MTNEQIESRKAEFKPIEAIEANADSDDLLLRLALALASERITLNNEEFELLNKGRLDYEYVYYPFVFVVGGKAMNILMTSEQEIRFNYVDIAISKLSADFIKMPTEECDSMTHDIITQLKESTNAQ